MKSRLPLIDLKGTIALLVLAIGTVAFAMIPDSLQQTTTPPAPAEAGQSVQFSSAKANGTKLPLFGLFLDASVTTDKQDYSPGDIVAITGSGFYPNEPVSLQVTYVTGALKAETVSSLADASGHSPWTVTADQNGNISSSWLVELDSYGQTLLVTAIGQSSGLSATHTFTDSVTNDFNQCANKAGGSTPNGQCSWLNGILQQNNSNYFEGMSTLQRLVFPTVTTQPGNNHTLTFDDDWTKGGKHAYDFLTSWEQGIKAGADNGAPFVGLTAHTPVTGEPASINQTLNATVACDESISATGQTVCTALHNSAFHFDVPVPDDAYLSNDGPVQSRINAYESVYGQRYIRIYGNAAITAGSFDAPAHSVGAMADTADSGTTYTLHWTSTSTQILIEWGEHISSGADGFVTGGGWGLNKGASSISGGPYHVGLDNLDSATIGSMDNQLKGADVHPPPPQGSITIIKDAIPDSGQDFAFTTTGGLTPSTFSLDDDGDVTLPNSQQYSGLANGTYTFTETGGVSGWSLVKLVCTDPNGGTTTNVGTRTASVNLSAGEAVTCTFTNVKPDAKIVISPGTATNAVGSAHTITATVSQDDMLPSGAPGDAATGFGPAPDGTLVTFSVTSGTATFIGGVNTCTTTAGVCTVQINSTGAGSNTIHATTTFSVAGVSLTRASGDGLSGDSPDAKKTYVDAKISLTPASATNEVGHAHTITATVSQDDGLAAGAPGDASTGFGPAPNGTLVTFSVTSGSATFVGGVNTCTTTGGTCSVQINSSGAGANTIHATTTFNVGGLSLTRATGDGLSGDGSNVTKTYVDAKIVLSPPTATNNVGSPHTITATVSQDDGIAAPAGDNVNGFGQAPNGTLVTFSLLNNTASPPISFVGGINTCTTTGGACSVQINSNVTGGVDIHATTTFSVGGVSLTRASGDGLSGDSANAHKDYVAGTIIIRKVTAPVGGTGFGFTTTGGLSPSTFSLNDGGNRTYTNVAPGSFSVTENDPTPGYDLTNINCSATTGSGTSASGNTTTRATTITLAAGGVVDCTYTNTKRATIIVKKHMIGGTDTFAFTGHPAGSISVDNGTISETVVPGQYTSTETLKTGWDLNSVTCDDVGSTGSVANHNAVFNVAAGQTVTCTFTNTKEGQIIVKKHMIGGTDTFAFTGHPAGSISVDNGTISETVVPGQYTSTETLKTGWDLNSVTCDDAGSTGSVANHNAVFNVAAGQTVTCTFTNTKEGQIIVKKHMIGGTDTFAFTGHPAGSISVDNGTISETVVPGQYTSTETLKTGWDLNSVSCDDSDSAGSVPNHNSVFNVAAGEIVTCTFTNTKQAHLRIDKVTNPSADPQSFNFTSALGNFSLTDAAAPQDFAVAPGTYSVNESATTGWTLTNLVCSDSSAQSGSTATVTLAAGQTVTCTFTNTKKAHLIIDKVTNPSADPQSFNFTSALGNFALTDQATPKDFVVDPGTYSVAESATAGWNLTNLVCSDSSAQTAPTASVTLAAGQTVTCTFTNTKRAHLIIDKVTNPSADPQSFNFTTALGNFALTDQATPQDFSVAPGSYSVTESATTGWDLTNLVCSDSSAQTAPTASVTLAAGQTVTCTFTNTKRGSVVVKKHMIGGTDTFAFTGDPNGSISVDNGTITESVTPGTYTSTETLKTGWDLNSVTCDDNDSVGSVGSHNAVFHVAAGETVTCTFTNTKEGQIIVKKHMVGGTSTFAFTGDPNGSISVDNGTISETVVPGQYTSTETLKTSWDLNSVSCDDNDSAGSVPNHNAVFNVAAGETVTCTFTNTKEGSIHVVKASVPAGGTGFTFTGDASGTLNDGQQINVTNLVPGTYHSVEDASLAWTLTSLNCTTGGTGDIPTRTATFILPPGGDITCTFTNSRRPRITLQKTIQGQPDTFHFSETGLLNGVDITISTQNGTITSDTRIIDPGSFEIDEINLPANWMLTDHICTGASGFVSTAIGGTVTAGFGDDILCSFVNDQQLGATRTQGFWSTHTFLANAIWNGTALPPGTSTITPAAVIGSPDAKLCTANDITATTAPGTNQLMGGFWANIANISTRSNKKRADLDKVRMQMLQQYLAAVLNVHAFGTPISGTSLATARAAYCGTNTSAIQAQLGLLGTYNQMGDNQTFTPGTSATSQESRLEADIAFWDTTSHFASPTQVEGGSKVDTPLVTPTTTTTKSSVPTFMNILILPGSTDDQTSTDPDKPKDRVKRPDQR